MLTVAKVLAWLSEIGEMHTALTLIGIVVELIVIGFAIYEVFDRRELKKKLAEKVAEQAAQLQDAYGVLNRYAGAVQMTKGVSEVKDNQALVKQIEDLGQYFLNWKKRNGLP